MFLARVPIILKVVIALWMSTAVTAMPVYAGEPIGVDFNGTAIVTSGSGDFIPYFIGANRFGILTQKHNAMIGAALSKKTDTTSRFSYGFGARLYAGWSNPTDYERFSDGQWTINSQRPSSFLLQELYGEVKYRGVFMSIGMKERGSALLDNELSSGDLTMSANARPIPEARIGFIDFQNIPFTNGWLQIQGEISYGKFADSDWWTNHYNYYNNHVATGEWFTYKRCYFRTDPTRRLSVTFGAQCAAEFAGTTYYYDKGELQRTSSRPLKFEDFFKIFLPVSFDEDFRMGNTLGSWDMIARYSLDGGNEIKAYFQWPWEDGSGMAKRNGWDGLWGLEYRSGRRGLLSGIVIEYLDLTNQSGPIHWAPGDLPGTEIVGAATGADDYYNNYLYNAYANYGMIIGTPMVMSPIYNRDGYIGVTANKIRGFHVAVSGSAGKRLDYKFAVNHRRTWGNGYIPFTEPVNSTSLYVGGKYQMPKADGLSLKIEIAMDRGKLPSNAFGAMIGVSYDCKNIF